MARETALKSFGNGGWAEFDMCCVVGTERAKPVMMTENSYGVCMHTSAGCREALSEGCCFDSLTKQGGRV